MDIGIQRVNFDPCIILGSHLKEECTVFTLKFILSCHASSPLLLCIAFSLDKGKQNSPITVHWHRCWSLDRH